MITGILNFTKSKLIKVLPDRYAPKFVY